MLIENCETEYSDWLMAEYAHCKEIWPNLTYTNVQNPVMRTSIAALGRTVGIDAVDYTGGRRCIILDHQADRELTRAELFTHSYVIVGRTRSECDDKKVIVNIARRTIQKRVEDDDYQLLSLL